MRLCPLLLAAVLMACHGPLDVVNETASTPGAPAWVRDRALVERTTAAADTAARAWGGSPGELDGFTVHYVPTEINGDSLGHTTWVPILGGGDIEIDVFSSPSCPEATVISHEVGHVIIGDHDHSDSRWHDTQFWDSVAARLLEIVPTTDPACAAELHGKQLY